ncbi:MAG: hypothetical protein ABIF77_20240 [bacterium]
MKHAPLRTILAVTIAIQLLNLTACDDPQAPGGPAGGLAETQYLFDVYHVNHAWGYTLSGFYLDSAGNAYSYDHSHETWTPGNQDSLTAAELAEKYSHVTELMTTVEDRQLRRMNRLIGIAARDGLTDPQQEACDMGILHYIGYRHDQTTDTYHPVVLGETGDWTRYNESEAAGQLRDWLDDLRN